MKKIFVAAMLALSFTGAFAQYPHNDRYDNRDYDNREYNNRDRYNDNYRHGRSSDISYLQREARQEISKGIQRGTLDSREASALMNRYERIEAMERKFSHRGRLSNRETRMLREDLERLMADTRRMSSRRGDHWARDRRYRY
ncbi:hypothetical protein [Dyadobacter sediminis]|uniref:Uncharacterized protein n=1 Tax=Dyadobacter sediminis TaxID=1493691 RepID=A0A5R9KK55_9BACT|nr:hypothetical protein [Dyadobacter sediminis]TLU96499.1 hypothetical protein FEM55_05030 [Dyadobacter sediminis]GGB82714.1 hypothetical protein GCM10011325_07830 [Dyadobacter sediminis]